MNKFYLFLAAVALAVFTDVSAQSVPEKSSGGKTKWYFIRSAEYDDCYWTVDGEWIHGTAKAGYNDPETMAKQLWCFTTDDDSLYTITSKYDGRVLDLDYHPSYEESSHLTNGEGIKYEIRIMEGREGFGLMTDRPCPTGNPIMRYPAFSGSYSYHPFWLVRYANKDNLNSWFISEPYDEGFETQNSEEVIYYNIVSADNDLAGRKLVDNTSAVDSRYKFVMAESAADNQAAQWRLVRCKNQTVAIVNRATGNSISNNLEAYGMLNLPEADGKEKVAAGYNIAKINEDGEFVMSAAADDGIVRYLNAAKLSEEPAAIDFENLSGSVFSWKFEKAGQEVSINGVHDNTTPKVSVVNGIIVAPQGVEYSVYAADGVKMPNGVRLPSGVYLVTIGGNTQKVIIR